MTQNLENMISATNQPKIKIRTKDKGCTTKKELESSKAPTPFEKPQTSRGCGFAIQSPNVTTIQAKSPEGETPKYRKAILNSGTNSYMMANKQNIGQRPKSQLCRRTSYQKSDPYTHRSMALVAQVLKN